MKKLLKLGAVLAALILALACFTACGGGSAGGGDDESGSYSGGNENTQTGGNGSQDGGNENTQTDDENTQTGEEEEEDTAVVLEDVHLQLVAAGKIVETDDNSFDFNSIDKNGKFHYFKLADGVEEIETFVIDSKYTEIGERAFDSLPIKSITIPASVTTIGKSAFSFCKKLESVTFAEGSKLEKIGDYAFFRSNSLEEIQIPASVKELGECALITYDVHSNYNPTLKATILATTPPKGFMEAVAEANKNYNSGFTTYSLQFDIYVPAESVEEYKALCSTVYQNSRIKAIEE